MRRMSSWTHTTLWWAHQCVGVAVRKLWCTRWRGIRGPLTAGTGAEVADVGRAAGEAARRTPVTVLRGACSHRNDSRVETATTRQAEAASGRGRPRGTGGIGCSSGSMEVEVHGGRKGPARATAGRGLWTGDLSRRTG